MGVTEPKAQWTHLHLPSGQPSHALWNIKMKGKKHFTLLWKSLLPALCMCRGVLCHWEIALLARETIWTFHFGVLVLLHPVSVNCGCHPVSSKKCSSSEMESWLGNSTFMKRKLWVFCLWFRLVQHYPPLERSELLDAIANYCTHAGKACFENPIPFQGNKFCDYIKFVLPMKHMSLISISGTLPTSMFLYCLTWKVWWWMNSVHSSCIHYFCGHGKTHQSFRASILTTIKWRQNFPHPLHHKIIEHSNRKMDVETLCKPP